jgi:predicted kinase
MGKLIVVIGLPGSGKSHYVDRLLADGSVGWICHDFHADAYNDSKLVTDSRYLQELLEKLRTGHTCAIADIAFCDPTRRERIRF